MTLPSAQHVGRLRVVDVDRPDQVIAVRADVADVDRAARVELPLHADVPLLRARRLEVVAVADQAAARRWSSRVVPLPGFDSRGFRMLTVLTNGGLVNAFCSKMPTSA